MQKHVLLRQLTDGINNFLTNLQIYSFSFQTDHIITVSFCVFFCKKEGIRTAEFLSFSFRQYNCTFR